MNPIRASWALDGPLTITTNTAPTRMGATDPTGFVRNGKVWRADRFASGPVALAMWATARALHAEAWGDGAHEAVAGVPTLVGLTDDPSGFDPTPHRLVLDMSRSHPGIRLGQTGRVFDAALRAVLGQKVLALQAKRSFRAL
ncbi:MAG: hypothetical protein Q8K63_12070, partial [Acidimicrobiales bacterium]|nr:hypothetical protein [Acidimicrobiales bacterium]